MTTCIDMGMTHSNLVIKNNFIDACNLFGNDSGGIYLQDVNSQSTNVQVFNNYVRDAGGRNVNGYYSGSTYVGGNALNPGTNNSHALYCDDGCVNVTWSGNIVSGNVASAAMFHDTQNVVYTGNLIDRGSNNGWVAWNQSDIQNGGNIFNGNIILYNSSGGAAAPAYQSEPGANGSTAPLTIANNVYYNYGGGAANFSGDQSTRATATRSWRIRRSVAGCIRSRREAPVFNSPVNFKPIAGGWGPPGFVVPQIGTPPSNPH